MGVVMANCGYVIKCEKEITKEVIDIIVKDFMKEYDLNRFFQLESSDVSWCIQCKNKKYYRYLQFWIGKYSKYDGEEISWTTPCVEFRHSHGFDDLMWWMDFALENYIASKLDGLITDDGDDEIMKPDTNKYKYFREYLIRFYMTNRSLPLKVMRCAIELCSSDSAYKYYKKKKRPKKE